MAVPQTTNHATLEGPPLFLVVVEEEERMPWEEETTKIVTSPSLDAQKHLHTDKRSCAFYLYLRYVDELILT